MVLKWLKARKGKKKMSSTPDRKTAGKKIDGARIISRGEHGISRKNIDEGALKVLYRLHKSGYQACLVGGAVRDLLLGRHPKDFDVATDATPEQVNALFRNCRLIGRRFRLAHIHFGRHIIEVATFRGHHGHSKSGHLDDSGRLGSTLDRRAEKSGHLPRQPDCRVAATRTVRLPQGDSSGA